MKTRASIVPGMMILTLTHSGHAQAYISPNSVRLDATTAGVSVYGTIQGLNQKLLQEETASKKTRIRKFRN